MKKIALLLTVIGLSALCSAQQTLYETMMHNNKQREYILYIPANYTGNSSVPLVLNFHGWTQYNQEFMEQADFRPISDTAGFILVYPQGLEDFLGLTEWRMNPGNPNNDILFTEALIDQISSQYNINPARIYSTGFSLGGYMSHALGCFLSERIAAIAPVKGSVYKYWTSLCSPQHPTPILKINNTSDLLVPYNGGPTSLSVENIMRRSIQYNNCNVPPTVTLLPDIDPNDNITVKHFVCDGGDNGVAVELFKEIDNSGGLGHDYPVSNSLNPWYFDSPTEIWNFFYRYDLFGSVSKTTHVHLSDNDLKLKLYPNPTRSILTVETGFSKPVEYEILSLMGERMLNGVIHSNTQQIDLSYLPTNIYVLKVGSSTYKIMKTN